MADEPVGEGDNVSLETARGRIILNFLRREYKGETLKYLETYLSMLQDKEYAGHDQSSPQVLHQILDQIRNSFDHLARTSEASDQDEAARESALASWHMDIARVSVLMELANRFHFWLRRLIQVESVPDSHRERCAELYERQRAIISKVHQLMRSLEVLREERRIPRPEEIEAPRALVEEQRGHLKDYVRAVKQLLALDGSHLHVV